MSVKKKSLVGYIRTIEMKQGKIINFYDSLTLFYLANSNTYEPTKVRITIEEVK